MSWIHILRLIWCSQWDVWRRWGRMSHCTVSRTNKMQCMTWALGVSLSLALELDLTLRTSGSSIMSSSSMSGVWMCKKVLMLLLLVWMKHLSGCGEFRYLVNLLVPTPKIFRKQYCVIIHPPCGCERRHLYHCSREDDFFPDGDWIHQPCIYPHVRW